MKLLMLIAMLCAALAGCGGGGGSTASSDQPPPPDPNPMSLVTLYVWTVDIGGTTFVESESSLDDPTWSFGTGVSAPQTVVFTSTITGGDPPYLILWEFGVTGLIPDETVEDPLGVIFPVDGFYPVTVTVIDMSGRIAIVAGSFFWGNSMIIQ